MKFEDLSSSDLSLIRNYGIDLYVSVKTMDRYGAIAEITLRCISGKGFKLTPNPEGLSDLVRKHLSDQQTLYTKDSRSVPDIVKAVFEYLESNNIEITKDETKQITWKELGDGWYLRGTERKKPWMF